VDMDSKRRGGDQRLAVWCEAGASQGTAVMWHEAACASSSS
jgi:hypothetical protein